MDVNNTDLRSFKGEIISSIQNQPSLFCLIVLSILFYERRYFLFNWFLFPCCVLYCPQMTKSWKPHGGREIYWQKRQIQLTVQRTNKLKRSLPKINFQFRLANILRLYLAIIKHCKSVKLPWYHNIKIHFSLFVSDREMCHSDQMSEGSQFSKVTICVKILKWR